MGKRIAKFLTAVPLAAGMIVNTNIDNQTNNKINPENNSSLQVQISTVSPEQANTVVTVIEDKKPNKNKLAVLDNAPKTKVANIENNQDSEKNQVTEKQLAVMEKMTAGHPIAKMLPYIAKRDPVTAAFVVAIAKKESNWGKVSPRKKNGDCFNYWGFKDKRFPFVAGHSCFPSAEAAVESVGNRIDKLVSNGRNTPSELVIWKCGSACAKDGNAGKWISDVNMYFKPIVSVK